MYYIQRKEGSDLETVDETTSRADAYEWVSEYRLADRTADYYVSTRACREWHEVA